MQTLTTNAVPTAPDILDSFLPPIDKPKGLMLKFVYYFSRREFGKVPGPLGVFAARLPLAFGMFYGKIGSLDKKLTLPKQTTVLIRVHVAQTNTCLFCIDAARSVVIKESMDEAKFDALAEYQTSPRFTEAERAALDYATELTKDRRVAPATFARLSTHYSDREICEIVWLVASEHIYNLTNVGLNIHSDMLCDVTRKKMQIAGKR